MLDVSRFGDAFAPPEHISSPAPWAGHTPFALWLLPLLRPGVLVELGTYSGISYLSFCQAVRRHQLPTRCYAVDTWQGDPHAGYYGQAVLDGLRTKHDRAYADFSTLMQMSFDEASASFANGSIDLLHIDGLHTYEAVRHDFETWRPKLSSRAVVLFHDTQVRQGDFGVHRYWAELLQVYSGFEFTHSHGLGILFAGTDSLAHWRACGLPEPTTSNVEAMRALFRSVGAAQEGRAHIAALDHQLALSEAACQTQQRSLGEQARHIEQLQTEVQRGQAIIAKLDRDMRRLETALEHMVFHSPREQLKRLLDRVGLLSPARAVWRFAKRIRNGFRYLRRGQWRAFGQRLLSLWRDRHQIDIKPTRYAVLTPPHTLYLGRAVQRVLLRLGLGCDIYTPDALANLRWGQEHDFYIVIAPQVLGRLPPPERRVIFQVEQAVNDRWFDARYLNMLESSRAVLEFSRFNLRYLAQRGVAYPHVFWTPIGGEVRPWGQSAAGVERNGRVLFYGDASAPRRQRFLQALQQRFDVQLVTDVFGEEANQAVAAAAVVVNIHYYEGALLESTRIFETLSLGTRVVSEAAPDLADYPGIESVVNFVPVDDVDAMVQAVQDVLAQVGAPIAAQAWAEKCHELMVRTEQRFDFMFGRALLAQGFIDYEALAGMASKPRAHAYALSLPETFERREAFEKIRPPSLEVFDGLRAVPGWRGCGLSYKFLCQSALEAGVARLLICEDDVELPEQHAQVLASVERHLDDLEKNGTGWDIYVGLIAHLHPEARVLDVRQHEGLTFVTLDKMTSMVFNLYSPRAMALIARWRPDGDAESNTIDRYLESQAELRVLTTLESLWGHREDLQSSLWGFGNQQYSQLIQDSRDLLRQKVDDFLRASPSP